MNQAKQSIHLYFLFTKKEPANKSLTPLCGPATMPDSIFYLPRLGGNGLLSRLLAFSKQLIHRRPPRAYPQFLTGNYGANLF